MTKLIEIFPNEYCYDSIFEYWKRHSKEVVVDGETYKKEWNEVVRESSVDFIKRNIDSDITKHVIDFPFINEVYYYLDTYGSAIHKQAGRTIHSENDSVTAYHILFNNGILSKKIKQMFNGKSGTGFMEFQENIKRNEIDIIVFKYGFNNSLGVSIKLKDFFEIENKKELVEYHSLKNYFHRLAEINIDEKFEIKDAIKLLKHNINNTKFT